MVTVKLQKLLSFSSEMYFKYRKNIENHFLKEQIEATVSEVVLFLVLDSLEQLSE